MIEYCEVSVWSKSSSTLSLYPHIASEVSQWLKALLCKRTSGAVNVTFRVSTNGSCNTIVTQIFYIEAM